MIVNSNDDTSSELLKWFDEDKSLGSVLKPIEVIVADINVDSGLLEHYGVPETPSFIGYIKDNKTFPMLKRTGLFNGPEHLKSWLKKLDVKY